MPSARVAPGLDRLAGFTEAVDLEIPMVQSNVVPWTTAGSTQYCARRSMSARLIGPATDDAEVGVVTTTSAVAIAAPVQD